MGENTAIAWTHATFNPWWGCVKVSPGCQHCYAETQSKRFGNWWGVNAPRRFFGEKHWNEPLKWNRDAAKDGVARRVFCGSMCDILETHQNRETQDKMNDARMRLAHLIRQTPFLTWLLLSKRIQDIYKYFPKMFPYGVLRNVAIGFTAENQEQYNNRLPFLAPIECITKFVSIEPQIGPITMFPNPVIAELSNAINWVIVGGESGAGCRPFDVEWARTLHRECQQTGAAFFMKQLGGHPNKRHNLADFPEDLRIREFPAY